MFRFVVGLWVLAALSLPATAEPYRLIIGDRIIVNYDFLNEPKLTAVDLDGHIRLAQIGTVDAAGRTLTEIETDISEAIGRSGFSGNSFVLVEIDEYAPVVVSGYVDRSGRYDYMPGMDVSTALALAGGLGTGDYLWANAEVLSVAARRRASIAAEDVAQAVADIARLEAALAGHDTPISLTDEMIALVEPTLRTGMAGRIEIESALLKERRAKLASTVDSYDTDIRDFNQQSELLDGRIILKTDIVKKLADELVDLEALRNQQLTTASRLSTQQQRLTDDREELLALETAKIAARRAATAAARSRDQFAADRLDDDLSELEKARNTLRISQREYRFALDELTVLSDNTKQAVEELPALDVRFEIRGPRANRFDGVKITADTPLLPGDVLLVEVNNKLGRNQ